MKLSKLLLLFSFVVLLQIFLGLAVFISFESWSDRGTFGDMFGVVNALFSGLAFIGVIYAIVLQSKELELQREELRSTRLELEKSSSAQASQVNIMQESAKLSTISAVLNAYCQLEAFTANGSTTHIKARDKREELLNYLNEYIENVTNKRKTQ